MLLLLNGLCTLVITSYTHVCITMSSFTASSPASTVHPAYTLSTNARITVREPTYTIVDNVKRLFFDCPSYMQDKASLQVTKTASIHQAIHKRPRGGGHLLLRNSFRTYIRELKVRACVRALYQLDNLKFSHLVSFWGTGHPQFWSVWIHQCIGHVNNLAYSPISLSFVTLPRSSTGNSLAQHVNREHFGLLAIAATTFVFPATCLVTADGIITGNNVDTKLINTIDTKFNNTVDTKFNNTVDTKFNNILSIKNLIYLIIDGYTR